MKTLLNLNALSRIGLGLMLISSAAMKAAENIYPDSITPETRLSDAPRWELGTIFRPTAPGQITQVRVFSLADETGDHAVRLWQNSPETLMFSTNWSFGGDEAWITLTIPPVRLQANSDYTISISAPMEGWYPANAHYFDAAGDNGKHLAFPQGAGVFSDTQGARPTTGFNNTAYLRDIGFEPDAAFPGIDLRGNNVSIAPGDTSPGFTDGTQFGGTNVNSGALDRTFTIFNPGSAALVLTGNPLIVLAGAQAGDFTVTAQPLGTIAPGTGTSFSVRFAPTAAGLRSATVVITNTAGTPYTFAIQGVGIGGGNRTIGNRVGSTTRTLGFGEITGSRFMALRNMLLTQLNVRIEHMLANTGVARLKCAVYADQGGTAGQFLGGTTELVNPTNGWYALSLTTPVNVSVASNYWLVAWGDADEIVLYADTLGQLAWGQYTYGDTWPDQVDLSAGANGGVLCLYAEGLPSDTTGPEMEVQGNATWIPDGSTIASLVDGTDFGDATIKRGIRQTTFTIYNVGQGNLTLTGNPIVTITGAQAGDFTLVTQPSATIASGASTTFTVRFAPSAVNLRTAAISIPRSDSPTNAYDFAIQGRGLGGGAGVLGYDSDGTFARNIDNNQIHGNRFEAPHDLRITELHAKVLELAGTFKCAVYSDNNGTADRLLMGSAEVVNATNGWNTFALTAPLDVTGGDFYWLVIWADTVGARVQADPIGTALFGTYSYLDLGGQWPDPISLTENQFADQPVRTYCLYGEGTPPGTVPGPELDLRGNGKLIVPGDTSPSVLDGTDFGSLAVTSGIQDHTFTLQNTGDTAVELTGNPLVSLSGPQAGDFVVTAQPTSPIAPGGSTIFTVRFAPTVRGLRTATVNVTNNTPDKSVYQFAVQGAGFTTGRESIWPDTKIGHDVDFDGTYYELGTIFHSTVAGKITHLRVFSLASETGNHTARIWRNADETVIGGPYTWNYGGFTGWIVMDIPDVDIDADTDYTVSISTGASPKRNYPNLPADITKDGGNGQHLFYPANAGVFTTTANARPTGSYNSGNYLRDIMFVPAGTTIDLPDIDVRGNNLSITNRDTTPIIADGTDFGSALVGSGSSDRTFTILNPGTAPLNLTGTPRVFIFAQSTDFAVTVQPSSPVPPGGSTTFTIRFSPKAAGTRTVPVSIDNDSDKNPFTFTISGTGVTASLKLIEIKADAATGNVTISWQGSGQQYQVEKAPSIKGPFQPIGSPQIGSTFTDPGALKTNTASFYRVDQL